MTRRQFTAGAVRLTAASLGGLSDRVAAIAAETYVSPDGDDRQLGVPAQPLKTLARAKQLARKATWKGGTVYLHGGRHFLPETPRYASKGNVSPTAPVTYRAHGVERAAITGNQQLRPSWALVCEGIFFMIRPSDGRFGPRPSEIWSERTRVPGGRRSAPTSNQSRHRRRD